MKQQILESIFHHKTIAIVRGVYADDCIRLARALYDGGIRLLEVTFDQAKPESWQATADTIYRLTEVMGTDMTFGAGTVTTPALVELACKAGGKFIISPDTNPEVIQETVAWGMVSIPGALTPTEVLHAHQLGADLVKLFPVGALGSGYVRAIHAPLNHIPLLAVGGVNAQNAGDFLAAGAVGVGVGGNLVNKQWIADGHFDKIAAAARELTHAVRAANR